MVIKLYFNENFPLEVVKGLRGIGYDVLTTLDAGKAGNRIPDDEVLDFSITEGRAVITLNRKDFKRLHFLKPNHEGIIICTENHDFISMSTEIDAVLRSFEKGIKGLLVRVYKPHI